MIDREELENLFRRNLLARRQCVQVLAALGMTAGAVEMLIGRSWQREVADAEALR